MINIEKKIENLIAIISPKLALQRQQAKTKLRGYSAAVPSRTKGSVPKREEINKLLQKSRQPLSNRVRELSRNFPYFAKAVNDICTYAIGNGFIFQSQIKDSNGKLNKKLNQQVEDVFKSWCDTADYSNHLHLNEMAQLICRQYVETGEFIIIRQLDKKRKIPISYQLVDTDWLTKHPVTVGTNSKFIDGIEVDKFTGQAKNYFLQNPDTFSKIVKVIAENVIHGYRFLQPGQVRGITLLAPAILIADDLHNYLDAEIDAVKLTAKWMAFVTTMNPELFQGVRAETEAGKKVESMENAIIEYLQPGESINFAKSERPGNTFEPFVKLIIRMISVTTNIPYEILSGDYSDINYSTARVSRNDLLTQFNPLKQFFYLHFYRPITIDFFNYAYLSNALVLPNYLKNRESYINSVTWLMPGMLPVDPLKEAKADIDRINNFLLSPQELTRQRGREYEDVIEEIRQAQELQKGLIKTNTSTSMSTSPSALETQEEQEEEQELLQQQNLKIIGVR